METTTLNCQNLPCPQPVLKTKEALEAGVNDLLVIIDNEVAKNNVERFARNQQADVAISEQPDGIYHIKIKASPVNDRAEEPKVKKTTVLPNQVGVVYVISSDTMGRGNDELGWSLLQTFVQTIENVSPLPEKILIYNGGVKLVTEQSGALNALKNLQQRQVEILVCGTCLDFYQLTAAIQVGSISNMFDLMDAMAQAEKIISPH